MFALVAGSAASTFSRVAGTTAVRKFAPTVIPFVRQWAPTTPAGLATQALSAVALNEMHRLNVKRMNRRVEVQQAETAARAKRPFWKIVLDVDEKETFEESMERRAKTLWDIVCYGIGNELHVLNFFTVKLVKGVLWVAGALVAMVGSGLTALGLAAAMPFGLSSQKYAELVALVARWFRNVCFAPFKWARRADNAVEDLSGALMRNRASRYMERKVAVVDGDGDRTKATVKEVPMNTSDFQKGQPLKAEIKIQPPTDEEAHRVVSETVEIKPEPPVQVTVDETPADGPVAPVTRIHYVTVTINAEAIHQDPVGQGRRIFDDEMAQVGMAEAKRYRQNLLQEQLRKAGVDSRDAALVLRGYDEALRGASGSTSATS